MLKNEATTVADLKGGFKGMLKILISQCTTETGLTSDGYSD